jgi:hypothetical protein
MNCRHCCPLIALSQELLRRIAWVDFGGVYYGTCISVGVWCSAPRRQASATRSSVSLPLPEGNAGGGAANRGAGNGRFRPLQNRHGPWMLIPG